MARGKKEITVDGDVIGYIIYDLCDRCGEGDYYKVTTEIELLGMKHKICTECKNELEETYGSFMENKGKDEREEELEYEDITAEKLRKLAEKIEKGEIEVFNIEKNCGYKLLQIGDISFHKYNTGDVKLILDYHDKEMRDKR